MRTIIMMGASGSGKSTYVQQFTKDGAVRLPALINGELLVENRTYVLSVDDLTFDEHGNFNAGALSSGHAACLAKFIEACMRLKGEEATVIVDNTNTTPWEVAPYIQAHQALIRGDDIEVVAVVTDWMDCAQRVQANKHFTPPGVVRRMTQQLNKTLDDYPPFYPPIKLVF